MLITSSIGMRIDKFLKISRIIKRRTIAKGLCDAGKVSINEKIAKAGDALKVGDVVVVTFGEKKLSVRVLSTEERARPETLYEAIAE